MQIVIFIGIFLLVLFSFLANPAPVSIEIYDIILIVLPLLLAFISIVVRNSYTLYKLEYDMLIVIMLYLSYLLLSIFIGLLKGIPLLNVLRAIGPYLNFFPLILLGLLPYKILKIQSIAIILILVGIIQGAYQIYLYFYYSYDTVNTVGVLRSRITYFEPRTTLPIIYAVSILPLSLLLHQQGLWRNYFLKIIACILLIFALFAGSVTLTRSIILAIFFGWFVYMGLYLYLVSRTDAFKSFIVMRRMMIYIFLFIAGIIIISFIPKIRILEQGLFARFYSVSLATGDYSNGRLYDEWIPAIKVWLNSGFTGLLFGIGAGNSFTIMSGEQRTYIHNILIYSLVYGGIYGLFVCMLLYYNIFKALVYRALQTKKTLYISFAALSASLFFYSQLFAVHKGLAFNAMLFLIISLILHQPQTETETNKMNI